MRRNGGVKIFPGYLESAKGRWRVLTHIDICPTNAPRSEMRRGEFIGLFYFTLHKGQSIAGQKLLLAIIVLVKIDFTFGGRGLEVEHTIDKKVVYERSDPVMGCLFISQDATAFHLLFFSGAQSTCNA